MAMIDFRKDRKSVNMRETEKVTEGSAPSPLGRRCGLLHGTGRGGEAGAAYAGGAGCSLQSEGQWFCCDLAVFIRVSVVMISA